jgi:acyl-coenzyme A thioesterase PaaI-like protein
LGTIGEQVDNEFSERAARVRESFSRQGFMRHLGAEVTALTPGKCEIQVPYRKEMTQQHGYFHAGVAAAIADSACGMPPTG